MIPDLKVFGFYIQKTDGWGVVKEEYGEEIHLYYFVSIVSIKMDLFLVILLNSLVDKDVTLKA